MPYDWLKGVERIIIKLVPAYTLEMLDRCDVERILPYYFYDYRLSLRAKEKLEASGDKSPSDNDGEIVIRNGKKYRKVNVKTASWANSIF